MSTLKVNAFQDTSGNGFYPARAWALMNASSGTPSINSDGNISSITDGGTGKYTYNFENSLTDANYSTNATTSGATGVHHVIAFVSNYGEETTGMTYTSSSVMVSTFNESNSGQRADSVRNTLLVTR